MRFLNLPFLNPTPEESQPTTPVLPLYRNPSPTPTSPQTIDIINPRHELPTSETVIPRRRPTFEWRVDYEFRDRVIGRVAWIVGWMVCVTVLVWIGGILMGGMGGNGGVEDAGGVGVGTEGFTFKLGGL